ncbi:YXWGXW repeat-containing protein [Ideonella sp.]|uniref:YXWGXW repeat-containing protein n=1 Tax=Ideonella sp. TaxID=1929293 RepID=UPI0035B252E8
MSISPTDRRAGRGPSAPLVLATLALALGLSACVVRETHHVPVVSSPPPEMAEPDQPPGPMPAPIIETRPTPPDSTSGWNWVPGHWNWTGSRWRWKKGHWVRDPVAAMPPSVNETPGPSPGPAYVWVSGHWTWRDARWVWVPGSWVPR